ncbi:MAG: leucyl aminopeptidase [Planctomycetaceae bacterium]|nr:leucyl aminopeptidase [Planctomycetaceae bacterium]
MTIAITSESIKDIQADAVVIGISGDTLYPAAAELNEATGGSLQSLIDSKKAKTCAGTVTSWLQPQGIRAPVALIVGLGDDPSSGDCFQAGGAAAKSLAKSKIETVAFYFPKLDAALLESAVAGSVVGSTGQDLHKKTPSLHTPGQILWATDNTDAVINGSKIGSGVNLTRELVNQPPNYIYPESFADQTAKLAELENVTVEIWDKDRLEAESCGSLLGVAQGSDFDPRLVIIRYKGNSSENPGLAIVGKGVTYDSGGLSLKPSEGQKTMKCDMAGAATVVGTIKAVAELGASCHIVGLVGLVENMVSGNSYRLGDVLTSRNGKTIEVLNTDAEGRLVLADVLDVTLGLKPDHIVDLATLTGACCVALGLDIAGLFTNDQSWCDQIINSAAEVGEEVWQLPMTPHFSEQLKSKIADLKNIGAGRWGGAITAAKFLEEFVGDASWTHIDIAGPAFADSGKSYIDGGASGVLVRTLVNIARGM